MQLHVAADSGEGGDLGTPLDVAGHNEGVGQRSSAIELANVLYRGRLAYKPHRTRNLISMNRAPAAWTSHENAPGFLPRTLLYCQSRSKEAPAHRSIHIKLQGLGGNCGDGPPPGSGGSSDGGSGQAVQYVAVLLCLQLRSADTLKVALTPIEGGTKILAVPAAGSLPNGQTGKLPAQPGSAAALQNGKHAPGARTAAPAAAEGATAAVHGSQPEPLALNAEVLQQPWQGQQHAAAVSGGSCSIDLNHIAVTDEHLLRLVFIFSDSLSRLCAALRLQPSKGLSYEYLSTQIVNRHVSCSNAGDSSSSCRSTQQQPSNSFWASVIRPASGTEPSQQPQGCGAVWGAVIAPGGPTPQPSLLSRPLACGNIHAPFSSMDAEGPDEASGGPPEACRIHFHARAVPGLGEVVLDVRPAAADGTSGQAGARVGSGASGARSNAIGSSTSSNGCSLQLHLVRCCLHAQRPERGGSGALNNGCLAQGGALVAGGQGSPDSQSEDGGLAMGTGLDGAAGSYLPGFGFWIRPVDAGAANRLDDIDTSNNNGGDDCDALQGGGSAGARSAYPQRQQQLGPWASRDGGAGQHPGPVLGVELQGWSFGLDNRLGHAGVSQPKAPAGKPRGRASSGSRKWQSHVLAGADEPAAQAPIEVEWRWHSQADNAYSGMPLPSANGVPARSRPSSSYSERSSGAGPAAAAAARALHAAQDADGCTWDWRGPSGLRLAMHGPASSAPGARGSVSQGPVIPALAPPVKRVHRLDLSCAVCDDATLRTYPSVAALMAHLQTCHGLLRARTEGLHPQLPQQQRLANGGQPANGLRGSLGTALPRKMVIHLSPTPALEELHRMCAEGEVPAPLHPDAAPAAKRPQMPPLMGLPPSPATFRANAARAANNMLGAPAAAAAPAAPRMAGRPGVGQPQSAVGQVPLGGPHVPHTLARLADAQMGGRKKLKDVLATDFTTYRGRSWSASLDPTVGGWAWPQRQRAEGGRASAAPGTAPAPQAAAATANGRAPPSRPSLGKRSSGALNGKTNAWDHTGDTDDPISLLTSSDEEEDGTQLQLQQQQQPRSAAAQRHPGPAGASPEPRPQRVLPDLPEGAPLDQPELWKAWAPPGAARTSARRDARTASPGTGHGRSMGRRQAAAAPVTAAAAPSTGGHWEPLPPPGPERNLPGRGGALDGAYTRAGDMLVHGGCFDEDLIEGGPWQLAELAGAQPAAAAPRQHPSGPHVQPSEGRAATSGAPQRSASAGPSVGAPSSSVPGGSPSRFSAHKRPDARSAQRLAGAVGSMAAMQGQVPGQKRALEGGDALDRNCRPRLDAPAPGLGGRAGGRPPRAAAAAAARPAAGVAAAAGHKRGRKEPGAARTAKCRPVPVPDVQVPGPGLAVCFDRPRVFVHSRTMLPMTQEEVSRKFGLHHHAPHAHARHAAGSHALAPGAAGPQAAAPAPGAPGAAPVNATTTEAALSQAPGAAAASPAAGQGAQALAPAAAPKPQPAPEPSDSEYETDDSQEWEARERAHLAGFVPPHSMGEGMPLEVTATTEEQEFLLAWNKFCRANPIYADYMTPRRCQEFVAGEQCARLARSGAWLAMRRLLASHLQLLVQYDLLEPGQLLSCLRTFDAHRQTALPPGPASEPASAPQ